MKEDAQMESRANGPAPRLVGVDEALELVLDTVAPLEVVELESAGALGLVLAETIVADGDYPPFPRAMMDGYAVRVEHAGRELPVAGEVAAGHVPAGPVPEDAVVAIMTGAPCPAGTDAVIPVEEVTHTSSGVRLPTSVGRGKNVAPRGSECRAGAVVASSGLVLTPLLVALLATVGRTRVLVRRVPTVAIVATGDELVPADLAPHGAQIRSSNAAMLRAMAEELGIREVSVSHVGDSRDELVAALERQGSPDIVLLSGGVSAGRYDLVPEAISAWGAQIVFRGVRQKPGKPLLFARRRAALVFGLPGNPLSAHMCFHRYVRPAIRKAMGLDPHQAVDHGRLSRPWQGDAARTSFQLSKVESDEAGWSVTPLAGRGSADLFSAAAANALVRFAPGAVSSAGEDVAFEWLDGGRGDGVWPGRPSGPEDAPAVGAAGHAHPIWRPIAERRSRRRFQPTAVPAPLLSRSFEAARWAPSAGNGQPWRFLVAHNGDAAFQRLVTTLRPKNRWAEQAPHLVLVVVKTLLEHPTKPPRPNELALLEGGLAIGNLLAQATADGLLVHPFDGFDYRAAAEAWAVPEQYRVALLLAIGFPADPAGLSAEERAEEERPRERLPLTEIVFQGRWGEAPGRARPDG
ncbi:MAG: molybdopterin-binding protein [Trueperaceae bacterium]|nr:molybdopterin-binding protein [Trueperaceae bacterium]